MRTINDISEEQKQLDAYRLENNEHQKEITKLGTDLL